MRAPERSTQRSIEAYAARRVCFAAQTMRKCIFGLRCQLAVPTHPDPNHDLFSSIWPQQSRGRDNRFAASRTNRVRNDPQYGDAPFDRDSYLDG
jgi:hypothetical protein